VRAVNLLPVAVARPRRRASGTRLAAVLGIALLAGVTAALVFAYRGAQTHVRDRQAALASLQAQIAALTPAKRRLSPAEQQLASQQAPRISAMNSALASRVAWDRVLGRLALVLPDDVWLTSLTAARPAPVAAVPTSTDFSSAPAAPTAPAYGGCGNGICISGYTCSQPSVARLLARLAVVPAFSNVLLVSSAATKVGSTNTYQFSISVGLSGQG